MNHARVPPMIIVVLVLTVAAIVVFLFYTGQLFQRADTYTTRAKCEDSIQRSIALRAGGITFANAINCPTEQQRFEGSDTEIKLALAGAMYRCWKQWREGTKELFPASTDVFCDVCSVFAPSEQPKTVTGLIGTLAQLNAPGTGQSYLDYIRGTKTTEGSAVRTPIPSDPLDRVDTSKPYAVIFRYAKQRTITKSEASVLGTALFGVVGGYIGYELGSKTAANWDAALYLVPHENLKETLGCTVFPSKQAG